MRNAQEVIQAIQAIFSKYDEKFPEDKGFSDADIGSLMQRTKARRRSDFLDQAVDALALTDEEIAGWEKHQDELNSAKAEDLFNKMVELGDVQKAEYILNNMKNRWDIEKRKAMAQKIGDAYDIDPVSGLLDTKKGIKRAAKERAREEANQSSNE